MLMKLLGGTRQPFVGLALAAAAGIGFADLLSPSERAMLVILLIVALGGAVLLWRPNVFATYAFIGSSFFLLHTLRTTATAGLQLSARLGDRPRMATASGTVVSEPKVTDNGIAGFLLRLRQLEVAGTTQPSDATIQVRWKGSPNFGDDLRLFGMVSPIAPPRNPGEFDMRSYLARRDVRRILFVRYPEEGVLIRSASGNRLLAAAQRSRQWLQSTLCRGLDDSPEVKDFISGITLGLRHQSPEDIEEPFQQTGTLHLFAVAGLHVGIVAKLLWTIAAVAGLSRRSAALAIIPLVLFYSAVTGLHISSVRAAVMSAVLMGGFIADRRVFTLNSLAAAAVLLLVWNTNELFSTGFQLSFAVVGAIVILAEPFGKLFRRCTEPDPFLPRSLVPQSRRFIGAIVRKVGQGASVSLAAWIGSLGLLFWYFHLSTPVSLVANLVVVPIAFLILAVALVSVISAPLLPWLSVVFNNANWSLAKLVIFIVHLFAQLPGGHSYLAHPPGLGSAVAKLTVLDVGAGAAVHLHTRHEDWLFDCGSQRSYDRVVREYLHSAGINRLDGLLLSHGDSQHIGGAARLLSEMRLGLLVDNPAPDRSSIHKQLRRLLDAHRLHLIRPGAGDVLPICAEVSCAVLYPPPGFAAPVSDDETLVLQLRFQSGSRVLFVADSGEATEKALIASRTDLRSDILVKGQHHSGHSGSPEFLDAVQPQVIVASSRDFPQHERIDARWAEDLRARNIKLFRQDETGAVEIRFRPDGWQANAYVGGETFRSSSR